MADNQAHGRAPILVGVLLVALGVMFLLGQIFHVNLWSFLWPFFVILPGLMFFVGMVLGGKAAGPLAIPGSIVTMTGLLLLYQSITGHWESWAYAWALIFPTSIGIGLVLNGAWSDVDKLVASGMKWITAGVIIFLAGGVFFELLIFRQGVGRIVLPLLLIALGIYLVARRARLDPHAEAPRPVEAAPRPIVEQAPQPPAAPEFEPLDAERTKK
jgi:hypothetical protein